MRYQRQTQRINLWIHVMIVLMGGMFLFSCAARETCPPCPKMVCPKPTCPEIKPCPECPPCPDGSGTTAPAPVSSFVTLHLIIAADTNDPSIGRLVAISADKFQNLFMEISRQSRNTLRLNPIILKGDQLTQKDIFESIAGLNVKQNVDVIVFLYTGHGHRFQTTGTKWPLLDTRDQTTAFSLIISKVKSKLPRQYVVLADSCNNVVDIYEPRALRVPLVFPYNYIKKLFIDPKIGISASGCEPGQFSWGYDVLGTYFTRSFITNLESALKNGGEWQSIMENTRESVRDSVMREIGKRQEPQFEIEQ